MRFRMKGVSWCVVLPLFLWTSVCGQTTCPTGTNRPELRTQNETSSLLTFNSAFMSPIVQSFLGLVQPNPFPKDLAAKLVKDFTGISQEMITEILQYEKGFLVCVAIGILYIVLMPLIGLIFACCRCCGNCGGRMEQKQTSNINCKRRSLYLCTFVITVLILAGNVCMFLSSMYTSETVKQGSSEVTDILENVKNYIRTVPEQIYQVINESMVTVDVVQKNLKDIGPWVGRLIQNDLKGPLDPAFNSATEMAMVISSTSVGLLQLNKTLELLNPKVDAVKTNLSAVRQRINNTLHMSQCVNCTFLQPELDKLFLHGSLEFPGKTDVMYSVNNANNSNVIGQANEGRNFFNNIPGTVTTETSDIVAWAISQLNSLRNLTDSLNNILPLQLLEIITRIINDVQNSISGYFPEVERAYIISRAVGLILSCLILLIVVCNFLGLLLGSCGLNPKDNPRERSGTSNCGGIFFMTGAGFSFLVSWIFMLIVLILLIVGGNIYTSLCKPWENKELIQFIDTSGLIPNLSMALNLKTNLTISDVYNDCQNNMPLWTTLHLNELYDLNNLSTSEYTKQIYQIFESSPINIKKITILTPETKTQIQNFSSSISTLNFTNMIQLITDFSGNNVNQVADSLQKLADKQTEPIKTQLLGEVKDLQDIQAEITSNIMPLLVELNITVKNLTTLASQISGLVGNVFSRVDYAQGFLNNNLSQIVQNDSKVFIDCQVAIFQAFVNWTTQMITQRIGRCGPAAAAVNRSEELLCKHLVGSLNSFWFSLGWCMIFLIPSIIFSIKLAKYYRKMKYSDIYENNSFKMSPFPKAQLKPELH